MLTGKFGDLEEADWDAAYDLLLKSAIRLIGGVLGPMRKAGWGRIIGITSVSVREPIETLLLSNVFRSGVTSLFKSIARDVAADGVALNTALPGRPARAVHRPPPAPDPPAGGGAAGARRQRSSCQPAPA